MQGLYVDGVRPKSKKQVKELVASGQANRITVEATSIFGGEYDGRLDQAPDGRIDFVGPCPHTKRSFYGSLTVKDGKVSVK